MLRTRETLLAIAVVAALVFPLVRTSQRVFERLGVYEPYDVMYVPRGSALRFLSPAMQLSVANMYWLATVQYVGEPRREARGFEKLFPLADLVTELDPGHGYAYQTAGIVLSAQGRLDESDRILKKGMQPGRPNWWSYPFYVAFNHFFYRGDYVEAGRWAEIAAKTPGASTNISHLAMALKVKSGSPDDAIRFLDEMRRTANDEASAARLEDQHRLAVLQRDFGVLDDAVARFREARGRPPTRLEELVPAGLVAEIPVEPFGGYYYLDADGNIHSSKNDHRFKPAEPGRLIPFLLRRPAASP
jgi:tetratricopeptide (TPR) repeat protein